MTMVRAQFSKFIGKRGRMEHGKHMKGKGKVAKVMSEFKMGKLHSGSKKGPVVKKRSQAVAIAMSESGMSRKKKASSYSPHSSPLKIGIGSHITYER